METHLALRLPQPGGIKRDGEQSDRDDDAEMFAIHE
jgi:hypothetical protein